MLRAHGRTSGQMRPIRITPHFTKHAQGSVLIEQGETKVICTVSVEDGVPPFLRNAQPPQGWLTAEYSMLPGSSQQRIRRERGNNVSGRTQEIQRLIGRSLRGIVNLNRCPDITFAIDCDVIQADGGTRTASITGAYVALKIAINKLLRAGKLHHNPLIDAVAALSIGIKSQQVLVDLDYDEDSTADLDMNVVMTQSGKILEIQGTAERQAFSKNDVLKIIEAAEESLSSIFDLQHAAADGQVVES
jgi:ribonuclease PH